VNLLQGESILATDRTQQDGTFAFGSLSPGEYSVEVVPPEGYRVVGDAIQTGDPSDRQPSLGFVLESPLGGGLEFDLPPGTAAPPATLGGYTMTPIPHPGAPQCTRSSPPLSTPGGGEVDVSPTDADSFQRCIGSGWATWSHDFRGDVYYTGGSTSQTIELPAGTKAFYLYVEPNPFSEETFEVVAEPGGVSSETFKAHGSHGATYVGVYSSGGASVEKLTITGSTDFATGEYGRSDGSTLAAGLVVDPIHVSRSSTASSRSESSIPPSLIGPQPAGAVETTPERDGEIVLAPGESGCNTGDCTTSGSTPR
jgi:hypothetical protein